MAKDEPTLELTPELILSAYAQGIFPMAESRDDDGLFWLDPEMRGVIPLDGFHISRSLRKDILRERYQIKVDTDFAGVIAGCADRDETWINGPIFNIYMDLFNAGYAHSVEVWDGSELVGGAYGVTLMGAFFGESMFSRRTNASKMALAVLVDRLRRAGFVLFDAQFLTDHLASLGAQEITRAEYHTRLDHAKEVKARFDAPPEASLYEVVQRMTQTS